MVIACIALALVGMAAGLYLKIRGLAALALLALIVALPVSALHGETLGGTILNLIAFPIAVQVGYFVALVMRALRASPQVSPDRTRSPSDRVGLHIRPF